MVAHWGSDQDVFGLYREGGFIEGQVLFVRQGKLTGSQSYSLEDLEFPDEEVMAALLTQFYQGHRFIPDEILLPVELGDREVREEYLRDNKGKRVSILSPQRGAKSELVEMARENARQRSSERDDEEKARERKVQGHQATRRRTDRPA